MQLYPFQKIPLFLVITSIICLFNVPRSLGVDDEQYLDCSAPFQCANYQKIGYPFWGSSRPDYCGYPEFELNCAGDTPLISFQNEVYRVLGINQTNGIMKVARTDYWNNVCPVSLANTTIESNHINYASDAQEVLLFYDCPELNIPLPIQLTSQFNCSINSTANYINYFVTQNLTNSGLTNISSTFGTCNTSVTVRISQSAAANLALNSSKDNLVASLDSGFGLKWDASNTLCGQCQGSGGQCGYNISSAEFTCYCKDGPYPSTCGGGKSLRWRWIAVALGIGIGGTALLAVCLFILGSCKQRRACSIAIAVAGFTVCCLWKMSSSSKKQNQNRQVVEVFLKSYGPLQVRRYSYSEVKKMTNNFKEKLGQGGYGSVYKGMLNDGCLVAVKVLNKLKGNGEEFMNEVATISRTSHVNVVTLLGFCFEGSEKALVYEFMPNGSLEKFIYAANTTNKDHNHLGWEKLDQISLGIARGLEYLHRGCNTRILHFDIKPHNILLDENFTPKISDFGLAKICDKKESIVSMLGARGTAGYIAPEVFCRSFGGVSHKSDVYSYGMMLSEMVGGRRNINAEAENTSEIYFPHWIYRRIELGEELGLQTIMNDEDKARARKMIIVSLWCIQTDPRNRPAMKEVTDMLEGSVDSLQIPPKPYLSSPPRSPVDSSTTVISLE